MPVRPEQKPEEKKAEVKTQPRQSPDFQTSLPKPLTDERTYGVVFVNEKGLASFNDAERTTPFPVGSMIVRETRLKPDGEPKALIALIKRPKGFNPTGGDWEFISMDGPEIRIRERQTTGSCLDCHRVREKNDFVFGKGTFPRPSTVKQTGDRH